MACPLPTIWRFQLVIICTHLPVCQRYWRLSSSFRPQFTRHKKEKYSEIKEKYSFHDSQPIQYSSFNEYFDNSGCFRLKKGGIFRHDQTLPRPFPNPTGLDRSFRTTHSSRCSTVQPLLAAAAASMASASPVPTTMTSNEEGSESSICERATIVWDYGRIR